MSVFSDNMAAVAVSLITEFGEACTFNRNVLGDYDPDTASVAIAATSTSFTGVCFQEEYSTAELAESVSIERTDVKLLVAPITGNAPQISDTVTFSSTTYRVIDVTETITNAATVLYELQVRE